MSESSSKSKQDKPFRELERYAFRILLVRNSKDFEEIATVLSKSLGLPALPEFQEETFATADGERTFKYLALPGKVPIYTMFLQNGASGSRRVLDVFELTAHLKKPCIVYVSHGAIPLFKLALLNNFPTILFHDQAEADAYLAKNIIGNDEKEILFALRQKQLYVTQQVKTRKEFAQAKKAHAQELRSTSTPPTEEPKASSRPREKKPSKQKAPAFEKAPAPSKSSKAPVTPYKAVLESTGTARKEAPTAKGSSWNLPVDVVFSHAAGEGPRVINTDALQHMVGSGSPVEPNRAK